MMEQEYLTDEALQALILEVESAEMTTAPPDLVEHILEKRKKEYRSFCIRVVSSMAAAIALLLLLPGLFGSQDISVPQKAAVVCAADVKTKEEVLNRSDNTLMARLGSTRYFSTLGSQKLGDDRSLETEQHNRIFK